MEYICSLRRHIYVLGMECINFLLGNGFGGRIHNRDDM